jgi:hypothetical protein
MSEGGKWQFGPDFQPFIGNSLWELRKTLDSCNLAASVTLLIATSEEARRQFTVQPLKYSSLTGAMIMLMFCWIMSYAVCDA